MKRLRNIFFYILWPRLSSLLTFHRRLYRKNIPDISGKEVLLVGTSPQLDFDLLNKNAEMFSIGLHRVHKIYHLTKWRPNILFLGDEALIIKHGKEIIEAQDANTLIFTGIKFWTPFLNKKHNFSFIRLRDKTETDYCDIYNLEIMSSDTYVLGDSVLCLALQYCIKKKVKKIIITGVNFNYDQGYIHKDINNEGINQPSPEKARFQFNYLKKVCAHVGIEVEHYANSSTHD